MLRLFGGYDGNGMTGAPARIVEEQRIVWIAERQAAAERAAEEERRNAAR